MLPARLIASAQPLSVTVPLAIGVGLVVGAIGWAMTNATYDTWGGMVVGVALLAIGLPLVGVAARFESDRRVVGLLYGAFALKLTAALVRLAVVFGVYDGAADANVYHQVGTTLAPQFRSGDFSPDIGALTGTGFMKLLTGLVYAVIGPTRLGGFLFFSFLGFWGLYCFYRAFCIACPEGDRWRYALVVFLLPSLLFWPSSIGKESWMTFTLGIATLGAARLLTHARGGLVLVVLGLSGTALVRPHVGGILLASLLVALLLRRPPAGATLLSPFAKLGGLVILAVAMIVLVHQAEQLFQVDTFNNDALTQVLQQTELRTSQGGSVFDFYQADRPSPATFPLALISVLFRPFPFEAHNLQSLIASVEGVVLIGVFILGWRRLVSAVRGVLRSPFVVLCCCYALLFVYGFSSFSNFGILTRQRVQVFPFLLVLAALPPFYPRQPGWKGWRALLADDPAPEAPPPAADPEPATATSDLS